MILKPFKRETLAGLDGTTPRKRSAGVSQTSMNSIAKLVAPTSPESGSGTSTSIPAALMLAATCVVGRHFD